MTIMRARTSSILLRIIKIASSILLRIIKIEPLNAFWTIHLATIQRARNCTIFRMSWSGWTRRRHRRDHRNLLHRIQ